MANNGYCSSAMDRKGKRDEIARYNVKANERERKRTRKGCEDDLVSLFTVNLQ